MRIIRKLKKHCVKNLNGYNYSAILTKMIIESYSMKTFGNNGLWTRAIKAYWLTVFNLSHRDPFLKNSLFPVHP